MNRILRTALRICCLLGPFVFPGAAPAGSGFIETPSLCHQVREVDGDRVFLAGGKEGCPGPGRARVTVADGISRVGVFLDGVFWREQELGSFGFGAVAGLLESSGKMGEELPVPDVEAGRGAATAVHDRFGSAAHQERLARERERLERELFQEVLGDGCGGEPARVEAVGTGRLAAGERVYLFVSSSVDLATLRRYAVLIDKAGDPGVVMVLRGFVGGMSRARPTIDYLRELLKRDPDCDPEREECAFFRAAVQIDPPLFARWAVSRVPAFLYLRDGAEPVIGYGDAALDYQLERLNRLARSDSLAALIAAMREGFYQRAAREENR